MEMAESSSLQSSSSASKESKNPNNNDQPAAENGSSIDRISNLPEGLLHHILSFLNMEEAIQTSFLSRRWRYLWTTIPTLDFNRTLVSPRLRKNNGNFDTIARMVDQVLSRRDNSSTIRRLHLYHAQGDHLDPWITYALTHSVQEIKIYSDSYRDISYRFPSSVVFTCSSLKVLELNYGGYPERELHLPDLVTLPALQTMVLGNFSCSEDDVTKLISACPNLEYLGMLACCFRCTNLSILSDKLKHLVLYASYFVGDDSSDVNIKLNVPNLVSFECVCSVLYKYWLENIASLVMADICMVMYEDEIEFSKLHVEKQILYAQRMTTFLKGVLGEVEDIKEEVQNVKDEVSAVKTLRLSNEVTEAIELEEPFYPYYCEVNLDSANPGDYWESGLTFDCLLYHLKIVTIQSVLGLVNELKILEILLKNAPVLEKLTIKFFPTEILLDGWGHKKDLTYRMRAQKTFYEKLLTFPKASPHVTILPCYH